MTDQVGYNEKSWISASQKREEHLRKRGLKRREAIDREGKLIK